MRYQKLDALRGIALVGMMIFHSNYLIENVFYDTTFHFSDTFWYILGRTVATMFIIISGVSFSLSMEKGDIHQRVKSTVRRFFLLAVVALLISTVTYIFFYEQRISFGIIHFFCLASLAGLFFVRYISWNILIGASFIFLSQYMQYSTTQSYLFVPLGIYPISYYSADYYPLIPWFGYYLIGFGMASFTQKQGLLNIVFAGTFFGSRTLAFIGKRALLFYVIHVPVIYSILYIVYSV